MLPNSKGVCLIIPPSSFLLDERVFMHIGVLKIAAMLEQAGKYVEVLDLSGYRNYQDAARDHAARSPIRHFGITATTPQLPAAVEIAQVIRATRKDARIIIGGSHVTLVSAAKKREEKNNRVSRAHRAYAKLTDTFDVLVAGDGEEAIFLALAPDAPTLIDADNRLSPLFLDSTRLNAAPFPARHLVDVESYRYAIDGMPALSIISQLGCPFACKLCAGRVSPMMRHVRMRTSENIVAEMKQLYLQYGRKGFMFYDDELNVNKNLVGLMCQIINAQRELGTEWRLRGFIKAELFTEDQAEIMYRAGFRQLLVGFESGSDRILKNINKKADQTDNTSCVEIAHKCGLKVKALMSLGHPGESEQTVRETRRWLVDVRPSDFDISIITPYPGSPYYDEAIEIGDNGSFAYTCQNGDRLYQEEVDYSKEADYFKGDPNDGYSSHVWTDSLSAKDLVANRNKLETDVREKLGIPFNQSRSAILYEHSMGQSLPPRILRSS